MASYQQTTSVSIRKGSTAENLEFTGLFGEITFDSGMDATGTDINTTLRLHNGINPGGIPLARSDLTNVTTKALAEKRDFYGDKNLAYANLSNIEELTDSTAISLVLNTLSSYGLEKTSDVDEKLLLKANRTMNNVDTSTLATGEGEAGKHSGKNLAYADMSNVTTVDLATSTGHDGKNLAYFDVSNINTSNLVASASSRPETMTGPVIANSDMSNISDDTLNARLAANNVEYITRKKDNIDTASSSKHSDYPTVNAVIGYVDTEIDDLSDEYATIDFDNVTDWNRLYDKNTDIIEYNNDSAQISAAGTGFTVSTNDTKNDIPVITPTSYSLTNTVPLQLAVYQVAIDENNPTYPARPVLYRIYPEYGKTDLTAYNEIQFKNNHGSTITSDFYCMPHPSISGVYCYFVNIKDEEILGPDGTRTTAYGWEGLLDINNLEDTPLYMNTNTFNVQPVLCIQPRDVTSGEITNFNYLPSTASMSVDDTNITIYHPMVINRADNDNPTFAVQNGNNATIVLNTISETPGAGLLRCDFENLPGITAYDKTCNKDVTWTINRKDAIPAVTEPSISEREYNRIATIGQVWDYIKKIDSKIVFRKWS